MRNNFDGVRLIAALGVLVTHQLDLSGHPGPTAYPWVIVFFGVSGYLVSQSWQRDPDVLRFVARRLLRIWPALAVLSVVLAVVFQQPAMLSNAVFRFEAGTWSGHYPKLDEPLWTIPYEAGCYLAVVVLGSVFGRWMPWAGLAIAGCFLGPSSDLWLIFVVGALMAVSGWAALAPAILAAALGHPALAIDALLPIGAVWVGRQSWPVLRDAGRFGDLSYGVYLWAFPVQQVVLSLTDSFVLRLVLSLAITLSLAWLSWHLVEKRALELKPRATRSDVAIAAA